ncbi:FtsW/RodA/SpoVE family cell cycle protein [Bacillus sp. S/N-304-OC-R1]|uniref:FtsW/RodA/SpoVE family cell cycle protein n=1 Tax=Bacillus sp. S/N-304-OC-R1 TaxID=2758034 RepID=UPI001C8E0BF3|nr:FtsW/RodA/SpoVE family cell cycle protein [Bacillus sp. S/N-304-OC-R1]MBY0120840.1 FtsW/RodA/SpoVE family cell cycle protein [Bacillus sp. S/N-304-OC-R1]
MLKKILKSYDYSLVIAVALLSIFGLIMIFSASMVIAVQRYGYPSDYFYDKQKLHIIFGAIAFVITALFPYKAMQSNKFLVPMVFFSLIGLFALFIFGHAAGNAQSWFKLGSRSLQPSEFVKLTVIIYLSAVYAKKQTYINEFNRGVVPPLVYLFLACLFVAIQPDFGTAAIIFAIAAMIIFSSGMSYKNILKLGTIGVLIVAPLVLIMQNKIFTKVRLGRFEAFQDPFVTDFGYHLVNSYLALGAGGVKGLGLGNSIQKLGYLPEAHTDFIMAVVAEELGAFGVCFVLLLLGYIVLRGLYIGLKCKDPFGSLLAIGISSMIGIQSFTNLAGISGVIPLTGVPLPFISYGGSSLLQLSLAMGILVNISMFVTYEQKYKGTKEKEHPEPVRNVSNNKIYNFRK